MSERQLSDKKVHKMPTNKAEVNHGEADQKNKQCACKSLERKQFQVRLSNTP